FDLVNRCGFGFPLLAVVVNLSDNRTLGVHGLGALVKFAALLDDLDNLLVEIVIRSKTERHRQNGGERSQCNAILHWFSLCWNTAILQETYSIELFIGGQRSNVPHGMP